jgi:hypothetical protein
VSILKIDYEASTVEISGRSFPTIGLVRPTHPKELVPSSRGDHCLGGPSGHSAPAKIKPTFQVIIPCENEVLVFLETHYGGDVFDISLMHQRCVPYRSQGDTIYLPTFIFLTGNVLCPEGKSTPKKHRVSWHEAEPEWTVELINRVSKMTFLKFYLPDGPDAEMIKLHELMNLIGYEIPGWL